MVNFERKETYSLQDLIEILRILRAPGGCPWDRAQTHLSDRRNFLEEAYEAAEAFDRDDPALMCEELGDMLMQVLFNIHIEEDAGRFDPAVPFGADGEMGTAVAETFPGVVEDLPVDEPAVAGQPDASGADSADGERDFAQSFTSQFHGKKILSWLKSSVTDSIIPGNGRKRNGKTGRKDMILCR